MRNHYNVISIEIVIYVGNKSLNKIIKSDCSKCNVLLFLFFVRGWYFRLYRAEITQFSRKRRRLLDFPSRVYTEYRYATPTDRPTDAHVNGRRQRRLRDPRLLCKYRCSLTRRDAKHASAFFLFDAYSFSLSFDLIFSHLHF